MPKVSIIIPTYNAAKYINEAVDSLLVQTYQDYEIIIIDDGSNDDTQAVLNQYGNKIKYIYQDNKGVSAARNRGICEAQGKFIAFLDADDAFLPNKINDQVSIAEQNPEIDLFFSDTEFFNNNGVLAYSSRSSCVTQYESWSLRHKIVSATFNDGSIIKGDFYKDLLVGNLIILSTVFLRKECLDKIGLFDEHLKICEDYDLWMRIALNKEIIFLNSITARYRIRDDSSTGNVHLRTFANPAHETKALEKQLSICPEIYKSLIKKRILDCYRTGIWGYYNLSELKVVRSLCLRSLSHDILQLKLYLYLLATYLPAGLIKSRTRLEF